MRTTILLLFFALASCSRETDPNGGKPYYTFTQDDSNKLLISYDIGKEFIFVNQDNKELKFKVIESKLGKTEQYPWQGFGPPVNYEPDFYYDQQKIELTYIDGYPDLVYKINLKRYPISGSTNFYGTIEFPLWNGYYDDVNYHNTISLDYNLPTISMTFNGKTYTKVRIIESNKTDILLPSYVLPFFPRSANKLYYDQNNGIIGFDDLNGKNWRLK